MHISELHIFQKDTDATEALRGYKYQELKTLEAWLKNRVENNEEFIYCDFEEDIFQRNLVEYKSKFRQIKLYNSKNFSFASNEIKKTISHFFMLYVKGEYLHDEVSFIFETNTGIAGAYTGNDAELLREWHEKQDDLSQELLEKIASKIKSVVFDALEADIYSEKNTEVLAAKKQIKDNLQSKGEEVWKDFSKKIGWDFLNITAEEEMNNCSARIFDFIGQLPYPISKDDYNIVFSSLLREVGERSIELVGENRVLSNELINDILLNLGDTADKRYNQIYKEWKEVSSIQSFLVGEFYEVISGANHCARSKYLEQHSAHWISLIEQYINSAVTPEMFKCDALYQYIWLKVRPRFGPNPMNSIEGEELRVKEFFERSLSYDRTIDFEHLLNILNLLLPAVKMSNLDIDNSQVQEWEASLEEKITNEISTIASYNKKCALFEITAFFDFYKRLRYPEDVSMDKVKESFDQILEHLPNAELFSVSQLSWRIDSIVEMLNSVSSDSDEIEVFEEFGNQLLPIVGEREGDFSMAKRFSQKGLSFLQSKKPENILKALDYFHKSKRLWYKDETMEGFLLAVLNISQLYLSIGMYSAAKYYAMSAAWYPMTQDNPDHYKRTSQAMGLVIHADILQGAWMAVLDDFKVFAWSWQQFSSQETGATENEDFWKPIFETATVLMESVERSPQLDGFIEFYKEGSVKEFYDQFVKPINDELTKRISETGGLNKQLVRTPLKDLGEMREIDWKCFGSQWSVRFKNDFENTVVAEEFVAVLQILLAEIALTKTDLYLVPKEVVLNLEIGDNIEVEQDLDSDGLEWNISLKSINHHDIQELRGHSSILIAKIWSVINEISLLPQKDLQGYLQSRMQEHDLISKLFILTSYQNCFRDLILESEFNESQRNNFTDHLEFIYYKEHLVFTEDNLVSDRYNKEKSLQWIKNRYKRASHLTNLTLDRIKEEQDFIDFVKEQRQKGALDWQIVMALMNTIIDYKAKIALKYLSTEDPNFHRKIRDKFLELMKIPEKDNYIEIPVSKIIENMKIHLVATPIQVLESFNLQHKIHRFITTEVVTEMLNKKFNFNVDDIPELSPLD
ncbi:hypothetical protein ERX46_04250 [Brumimicrobium glaciale]|uniref:DUF4297 domain-containing protein n=1 Tax=Brumimicrobium glaciale TaxID=200475 RepID=A0A4Q4KMG2_9FLAO|nr:hypothetical protein [Brumimicrobium glaciale]RYM34593.1 hypothetical protein ERX46_04250 [Brumimicrobium glaciale]